MKIIIIEIKFTKRDEQEEGEAKKQLEDKLIEDREYLVWGTERKEWKKRVLATF